MVENLRMENPTKMDDLGVPPFQETSIYFNPGVEHGPGKIRYVSLHPKITYILSGTVRYIWNCFGIGCPNHLLIFVYNEFARLHCNCGGISPVSRVSATYGSFNHAQKCDVGS